MKVKAANTAAYSTTGEGQPGTIGDLEPVVLLQSGASVTPTGETATNARNVAYTKVRAPGQSQTLWVRSSSLAPDEAPQPQAALAVTAAAPSSKMETWQIALIAAGAALAVLGLYSAVKRK